MHKPSVSLSGRPGRARLARVARIAWPAGLVALLGAALPASPALALRELSTDRPDRTESAYSVDAGHLQLEMDAAALGDDQEGDVRSRSRAVAALNGKLGLASHLDLQVLVLSYLRVRENLAGTVVGEQSGFGGGALRLKWNVFGNDSGPRALAFMPFVEIPNRDAFQGARNAYGLIMPFAQALPAGWSLGAMLQADARADDFGDGYHGEWVVSGTVSHAIAGPLAGYVELYSRSSSEPAALWRGTADAGLTWALGELAQLDLGANVGLSDASEDLVVFLGFAVKR